MPAPNRHPLDFEDEFERAVADWRQRHRLREDDAVLLLVDLFRIHQRHWDELRHREMPAFGEFRNDLTNLSEAARTFHKQSAALLEILRTRSPTWSAGKVTRAAAFFATLAGVLAGYLIGKGWP